MKELLEVLASGERSVLVYCGQDGLWVVKVISKPTKASPAGELLVHREETSIVKALQECACKLIEDGV